MLHLNDSHLRTLALVLDAMPLFRVIYRGLRINDFLSFNSFADMLPAGAALPAASIYSLTVVGSWLLLINSLVNYTIADRKPEQLIAYFSTGEQNTRKF